MKKFIVVILFICIGFDSFTQPKDNINAIARELSSYQSYLTTGDYTFSMSFGEPVHYVAAVVLQKVPSDTLCGFYYDFEINENERGEACHDFAIYFNNSVYNSYEGKVRKTSLNDKPEAFKELKIGNNSRPAIQHSPSFYYITPYILAKEINKTLDDDNAIISQNPDTIINQDTCSRFLLKTEIPNSSDAGKTYIAVTYELCFHKSGLYPVYYKKDIKSSYINSYQTAHFRNTKVNSSLLPNYFSEDNLLPKDWANSKKTAEKEKMNPDNLIGQNAPDWNLPVLGKEEILTNKSLLGKYVLMDFTATWCTHCIKSAEMMNRLEDKFKNSKNVAILSIFSSNIDKKESVLKFAEKLDLHSTILYSADQVGEKYYISNYPNFFIISPKGKVLMNFSGYNETLEKNIINVLSEFAE
jgi:thiol-disulfide isomerase/thioredoxin